MKKFILFLIILINLHIYGYGPDFSVKTRIIDTYIAVMPPLFSSVLEKNKSIIIESFTSQLSMLENQYPVIDEGAYNSIIKVLEGIKNEQITKIRKRPNFKDISKIYGLLAAYSFYLNNPISYLDLEDKHKSLLADQYYRLMSHNNRKFRIFFYGFYNDDAILGIELLKEFSGKLLRSFMKDDYSIYPFLHFDERSIPFGIVQMHLNSSFSFTTMYWFSIWKDSGGYIKDSPYYNKSPAQTGHFLAIID